MSERSIFLAALDIPDPAQRSAYLDQVCGNDAAVRKHIEELIAAEAKLGGFLAQPHAAVDITADVAPATDRPGTQIGRYKLLQQIGEGGMGVVYMAEQKVPVSRRVALKIIKPGMDTRQVIARFESERQALSMMDHPNIAKVLEAGSTDSGRPYFVMELVKGQPITQYCDEHHLTPRERLELFLPVCQAIQHAHQKGIIHRDVKPSNILVAEYDQQAVPKVIDFGVAKATSQTLTEKTMFTGLGQIVGTLEYMSPEQAKVNQLDIDTRSDIYSLGVLLYELLTGTTPFDKQRLRSAAFDEMLRIIREEEPPRPSTRLSTINTLVSVATNRKTEPGRLSGIVRGELDWIVMKALDKDRSRRYETANGLAMDIQRYLQDEPVQACPPSAAYRLKKVLRRNKGPALAAAIVLLALVGGIVGTTWGLILADQSRRAESQQRMLAETRLKAETEARSDAVASQSAAEKARQDEVAQRALAEQRRIEADKARDAMQINLADVYTSHGITSSERNESAQAALWFANAARLARKDPNRELANRVRARNWGRQAGAVPVAALKHSGGLTRSLHFHPHEPYLLAVAAGNKCVLWNLRRDEQVPLPGGTRPLASAAWHPDGRWLALATPEGLVEVFSFPAGERLHQIPHRGKVRVVAFSGNGRYLAVGGDAARVWDCTTHEFAAPELAHPQPVETLSFSSRGDRLVTGCRDNQARVFAVPGGDAESRPLFDPVPHVWNLAENDLKRGGTRTPVFFDNDRALLTATGNTEVSPIPGGSASGFEASWWNAATGELIRRAPALASYGTIAVSPTDQHFVVTGTGVTRLWDVAAARPIEPSLKHLQTVVTAAFSPDGRRLLTGGIDRIVRLWSVPDGQLLASRDVHSDICQAAFSPDGRFQAAAATQGGVVFVWASVAGNSPLHQLPIDNSSSLAKFSRDGRYAVPTGSLRKAAQMRTTTVFEVATGRRVSDAIDPQGIILDAELSPDNRQLAILTSSARTPSERDAAVAPGAEGNKIDFWDWQSSRRNFEPVPLPAEPRDLKYSPDGTTVAVICGGGQLLVIDSATGRITRELQSHATTPAASNMYKKLGEHRLRFSPDGQSIIAWGTASEILIWETATGRPRAAPLNISVSEKNDLQLSADGRLLATTSGVWEFDSGRRLATLPKHPDAIFGIAFSPDGTQLLTACRDGMARLWDWRAGRLVCPPFQHEHEAWDVAFTPDARWVLSASLDGIVRLWDPHTGKPIAPPLRGGGGLLQMALTADGTSMLAAGITNAVSLFNLQDLTAHDAFDIDELCAWGEILAHQKIDEGGDVENLSAADWLSRFRAFRQRHPESVQAPWSPAQQLAWHRGEAAACENQRQWSAALPHIDKLVAAEPQVSSHLSRRGRILFQLGLTLLRAEQFAEAEPVLRKYLQFHEQAQSNSRLTSSAKSYLGRALLGQQKYAEAEPLLLAGYEGLKQTDASTRPSPYRPVLLSETLQRLIDLYTAWDKPDQTAKWRKTLDEHKVAERSAADSTERP